MLEAMLSSKAIPKIVLPDSFMGEVLAANFITATAMAAAIGLTPGTLMNNTAVWLKFNSNGKTLYIPKKCIRNDISWEQLDALGCVLGSKTVSIGGLTYKVRLMTGAPTDPSDVGGGEYNSLLSRTTTFYNGAGARWANYTATDLGYTGTNTNGNMTLVKEAHSNNSGHIARGYPSFLDVWYQVPNSTNSGYGWRPVLELVE